MSYSNTTTRLAAPDTAASHRAHVVLLLTAIVVGAILRSWRLGHQSLWYDEWVTAVLLHHSLGGMLTLIRTQETTPPVFYCVAWVWARVFGFGTVGIRSLSAVAGAALIPVVYAIGARLISRRAGLVAAWLTACNPFLIWYSQEARSYSLLALMVGCALLAFTHLLAPPLRARWIIAWVVLGGLALGTHYFAIVALVPAAIWLLWRHRRNPWIWYAMLVLGAVGIALVPLAHDQMHGTRWIADEPLESRLAQVPAQFVRGTWAQGEQWLDVVAGLAVALGAGLLVKQRQPGAALAAGLGVAGFLLSLILALGGLDFLIARNLIAVLILLIVAVGGGLGAGGAGSISPAWDPEAGGAGSVGRASRLGPRTAERLGVAGAAVLAAVGVTAAVVVATNWRWQRSDWAGVAEVSGLAGRQSDRDVVIWEDPAYSLGPLTAYSSFGYGLPPSGARVRTISVVAADRGIYNSVCWWGATCHLRGGTLDTDFHLSGFHRDGSVRRAGQFTVLRLTAGHPIQVTRSALVSALGDGHVPHYLLLVTPPG